MERLIPFADWFKDVESLMSSIDKCNFDILDYSDGYNFDNLTIYRTQSDVYKFNKSQIAEQFRPVQPPPPTLAQIATSTLQYTNISISSSTLISYKVSITCTRERIIKLEVVENWTSNFNNSEKTIHSVVFHDNDLLVNGKWYKIDSPEAFTHDLVEDDISVLALIELFENFRKSA